jgi:hypothetical protein
MAIRNLGYLPFLLPVIAFAAVWLLGVRQADEWADFAAAHHCRITEHRMATRFHGGIGWLCDDGLVHWPN